MRVGVCCAGLCLALGGCYRGAGVDPGGADDDATMTAGTADDDGDSGSDDGVDEPPVDCTLLDRRIHRLSSRQYGNAIRDLFGLSEAPTLTSVSEVPEALFPGGAAKITTPIAYELQTVAHASAQEAVALGVATCGPTEAAETCVEAFIRDRGARAFRRPLTDGEVAGLLGVFATGFDEDGTYEGGIELVIATLLQSPSFLYRRELGNPVGEDRRYVLDDFEIASALSFFLLDSIPDDPLWNAAADGRLSDDADLRAEIERLLELPRVRANLTRVFMRWFETHQLDGIDPNDPAFTPELAQSMERETELFVEDVLWSRDARLAELLTSNETFVDAGLAEIYGVAYPGTGEFERVTLPATERSGLLTQASLLSVLAERDHGSIVRRGLFVASDLLCRHFPEPPPGATDPENSMGETERERAEYRMSTAPCSGCHAHFEHFGVVMEAYGPTGRFDASVDAAWDFELDTAFDGTIDGPVELADQLVQTDELTECVAQRVLSVAIAEPLTAAESCQYEHLVSVLDESGGDLVELIRAVALSPAVRFREEG